MTTTNLTSDEREQQPQTPEQIFIIPTKQWGLIPTTTRPAKSDYVEYQRADVAATSMRSLCVEKVRERLAVLEKQTSESSGISRACCEGRDAAIREIVTALESLTLDQVEQKRK